MNPQEKFIRSLLNPEELGMAVPAHVRDEARKALGRNPVESAPPLRWQFDGQGQWTASSVLKDEGVCFTYTIGVCDDGSFDVSESDSELLGGTKKIECFASLDGAKDWCQGNELVVLSTYQGD